MAAGDVAGFVREHADNLVGIFSRQDEAGVDEDVLTAGDERVHARIVDDVNFYVVRIEARGFEQRVRIDAQRVFDLGVADEPLRRRVVWPSDDRQRRERDKGAASVTSKCGRQFREHARSFDLISHAPAATI